MTDNSHAKIGQRIKKSKDHPLGWKYVDAIPPDMPCILTLSGSNTDNSKKANGFAKMIEDILKNKKIALFSAEYDTTGRKSVTDRLALLNHYNQGDANDPLLHYREEEYGYIPQYIKDIYQKTIAPRLRDENGNKVAIAKAAQRLNMISFVNHCQGSTVAFQMERLMKEDLKQLGYSDKVQDYLLKQVHNIDVAPVVPIGITQTTTIKFGSLSDEKATSVHTPKVEYILRRKREHERFMESVNGNETERKAGNRPFIMNFSVFRPTSNETIFAVNNIYPVEIQKDEDMEGIEHVFASYSDKDDDNRTKQGNQLSQALHEVVNIMAEHSLKNEKELTELPDIFKMPKMKRIIERAQNNRYDFMSKETKILRARRNKISR